MYKRQFPVGASCPPEMVSGSIIGTSFVIKSGGDPGAAVALAVPVATLVLMIKSGLRVLITSPVFCAHADKYAANGDVKGVIRTAVSYTHLKYVKRKLGQFLMSFSYGSKTISIKHFQNQK